MLQNFLINYVVNKCLLNILPKHNLFCIIEQQFYVFYVFYIELFTYIRNQNERIATLESARAAPPTPSSLLDFNTPRGQKKSNTDFTSPESDLTPLGNESFSSGNSEMTPQMDKLTLGHGRGRPRKKLNYSIDMDDFPTDGTEEEKDRYLKKKSTELWRFRTLTGAKAAEHRAKENECVKKYYQHKKAEKEGSKPSATGSIEHGENDEESDGSVTERKKELSRER